MNAKFIKTTYLMCIFFLSEHDRSYITNRYGYIRTIFSPIGVNDIAVSDAPKKYHEEHRILFLGNLSYSCNIESISWFVHKVYPIIISNLNNVSLYLVGKQPTQDIYALARRYRGIRVIPDVPVIAPILARADIVVAPIISGGGVKVKVLDALSARKLVVSTRMGIEGTTLEDRKHLLVVKNLDHKEFVLRCIEGLIKQKKLRHILNEGYKYVIHKHGWYNITRQLYHDLNVILEQKRG